MQKMIQICTYGVCNKQIPEFNYIHTTAEKASFFIRMKRKEGGVKHSVLRLEK